MILGIVGSRNFTDYQLLKQTVIDYFCIHEDDSPIWINGIHPKFDEVVSGGAQGADSFARVLVQEINGQIWDERFHVKMTEFLPDWSTYGKAAGPIRNRSIIERADVVLCCWNGESRGTKSSLSIAKELKKPTLIIYFS